MTLSIPRDKLNDYTAEMAARRRAMAKEATGVDLNHVGHYSVDPASAAGNIENFMGVAQVPIGIAGPILIHGEHAQGHFYAPLATTEGTLVASYNRGMKLVTAAGGVRVTVCDDAMNRAPIFIFGNALLARNFGDWVRQNFTGIKAAAEATSSVAILRDIEQYPVSRFLYLRFNYTTGDAAGQNMVTKATHAACAWMKDNYEPGFEHYLEANMATDKKSSRINMLHARGKRVTAEVTIPNTLLEEMMGASAAPMYRRRMMSTLGALMCGAHNNGAHSANAIAAMFIATGQDVGNVAESSAAFNFAELTPEGDYYISLTIPSLIVATYGGGTGLATQRECLEMMDCYGKGKVYKLAEIVAAVALAGELSLASAVVSDTWVSSHERYGRNRP